MTAATQDLTIEQGTSWALNLRWKDGNGAAVDLTGYTARMQIRESYATPVLLSLGSAAPLAGITLGGAAGTITVAATAPQTAVLPAMSTCVYDLELVEHGGLVRRFLQGSATVSPEVTK